MSVDPRRLVVTSVRSSRDFAELSRSPHRGRSGPVWVRRAPAADETRVAYAIGRSVGPAVTRNRIRRRLRPLVAELAATGGLADAHYLIGASNSAADLDFCELRRHLSTAIRATEPRVTEPRVTEPRATEPPTVEPRTARSAT